MIENATIEELYHLLNGLEGTSVSRSHERRLFGPKSPTRVTFKKGLLPRQGILKRTLELVADGKTDYTISRVIMDEFPGKTAEYPFIRNVRKVVEGELGRPMVCKCGILASVKHECATAMPPIRRNKALDAEAARQIREEHASGQSNYTALARKYKVRIGTIIDLVEGKTHSAIPLKLARFKARRVEFEMKRVRKVLQFLIDGRSFCAGDQEGEAFDTKLIDCADSLDMALADVSRALTGETPAAKSTP